MFLNYLTWRRLRTLNYNYGFIAIDWDCWTSHLVNELFVAVFSLFVWEERFWTKLKQFMLLLSEICTKNFFSNIPKNPTSIRFALLVIHCKKNDWHDNSNLKTAKPMSHLFSKNCLKISPTQRYWFLRLKVTRKTRRRKKLFKNV